MAATIDKESSVGSPTHRSLATCATNKNGATTLVRGGSRGSRVRSAFCGLVAAASVAASAAIVTITSGPTAFGAGVPKCVTYTVSSGDSIWRIARRYGSSREAILTHNGLDESTPIKPGQVLEIPPRSGKCTSSQPTPVRSAQTSTRPSAVSGTPTATQPRTVATSVQPAATTSSAAVARPPAWTQTQKSAAERGVNPCNTPDPGFGIYDPWDRRISYGQMISPQKGGINKAGEFDVMFHFHGHEAVRKEWVQVMDGAVLVGLDLGIGSGPYEALFRNPGNFEKYLRSVEAAMAKKTGNPGAHARKIGLSSWSAGYGSVGQILKSAYGQQHIDTVILLDGLHCGYVGKALNGAQLEPFIAFARQAAQGKKFMFISHSSIIPPGYASTTETTQYLIDRLNGRPMSVQPKGKDPMGLDRISMFDHAGFHARGFLGNDKLDHCAHIGLLGDILKVHVQRRWKSPKGRKA